MNDAWNPYEKEQPRFRRPRTVYVFCAIVAIISVGIVASLLSLRQPPQLLSLPVLAKRWSEPLPIKGHDLGSYEVEDLSVHWKGEKNKGGMGEPVDTYEVTGLIRRKDSAAPADLTLKVEMRSGVVRLNTTYHRMHVLALSPPQNFKITIEDATHARLREADINFIVSAEPGRSEEGD